MTIQDRIIALIRTVVPYLWSALLVWLVGLFPWIQGVIDWLDQFSGQDTTVALGLVLLGLVLAAYYWLARTIGAKWPPLEKWLLGRSMIPVYSTDGTPVVTSLPEQISNKHAL